MDRSVHTYPDTQRIQKFPLWRAYTEISGYTDCIRQTRVDAGCIRIKKIADTKISGYVWTGPNTNPQNECFTLITVRSPTKLEDLPLNLLSTP